MENSSSPVFSACPSVTAIWMTLPDTSGVISTFCAPT